MPSGNEVHEDSSTAHTLVVSQDRGHSPGTADIFSSLHQLLRVTALVLKFVCLHLQVRKLSALTPTDRLSDIDHARLYWLRDAVTKQQVSFV